MAGSFTVGDFRTPDVVEPRRDGPATPAPTPSPAVTAAPAEVEAAAVPKTPAELYAQRLEDAGISRKEAGDIFDDVLTKGFYQEVVNIKGRKAVLRTRAYEDHIRSLAAIETQAPRFQMTQEELQARYNLAASLVEWNGTVFKKGGDPDREFTETMNAVKRLPGPVYALLVAALVKFDARMFVVFSDGATESF